MILSGVSQALHKAVMYRVLSGVLDNKTLSQNLLFKGGTAAALLDWLDRFSIDLDFDLKRGAKKKEIEKQLDALFANLNLKIDQESLKEPFFVLKYEAPKGERNTLKFSVFPDPPKVNIYQPFYLSDLKRYAFCQTKETMFANKLAAVFDRFQKYQTIAGRDIYDIHHFFLQGFNFEGKIIKERLKKNPQDYLLELAEFIDKKVSEKILREDLNWLLPPEKFKAVIKTLKMETLIFLKQAASQGKPSGKF